jgi:hypothetical protein
MRRGSRRYFQRPFFMTGVKIFGTRRWEPRFTQTGPGLPTIEVAVAGYHRPIGIIGGCAHQACTCCDRSHETPDTKGFREPLTPLPRECSREARYPGTVSLLV